MPQLSLPARKVVERFICPLYLLILIHGHRLGNDTPQLLNS